MSSKLNDDQLHQLAPLLASVSKLLASQASITDDQLSILLDGNDLGQSQEYFQEIRKWAQLLVRIYQSPSPETCAAVIEALKNRGLQDAEVILAVSEIVNAANKPGLHSDPIIITPENINLGYFEKDRPAVGEFKITAGEPGKIYSRNDAVSFTPAVFSSNPTTVRVEVKPQAPGVFFTDQFFIMTVHGHQATVKLIAEWKNEGWLEFTTMVDSSINEKDGITKTEHETHQTTNQRVLELVPGVEMIFVRIPAGEFLMGSNKSQNPQAYFNEMPPHKVYLDEYWMGKYPVTVAQFTTFVKVSRYERDNDYDYYNTNTNHPVTGVSWSDGNSLCKWAIKETGKSFSLPTEAQWEKAARGTDGRLYPWGNQVPDPQHCNFNNDTGATTIPGNYSPQGDSPYGCADMAGNVWEWVHDWYDKEYYDHSPYKNPKGPASGEKRVMRGGSYQTEWLLRTSYRESDYPSFRDFRFGFRCVVLL